MHARTCECAMASSTGQSSSDRLVSCIALAAVHNSPSPCPSLSPLASIVSGDVQQRQLNSAAPDTNPFPRRVSNRGGALLKKCAVSPPFPHAVPQVISRKPLVHFQAGRPTWRLVPFLMFRVLREQRRWLAASPGGAFELGTVLERYKPADSYYRGWLSFSSSTLAVVKLRSVRQLSNPHELQVREQEH